MGNPIFNRKSQNTRLIKNYHSKLVGIGVFEGVDYNCFIEFYFGPDPFQNSELIYLLIHQFL